MDTFIKLVKQMRHHQRKYFILSKFDQERKHHLQESKRHEILVDQTIAALEAGQTKMQL